MEVRKRSVGGHSRMTSRIGEKLKGGPNGSEERIRRNGVLAVCRPRHYELIIGKVGVLGAQLGLLKDTGGLLENRVKADPTDTELCQILYMLLRLRPSLGSVFQSTAADFVFFGRGC